MILVTGGTGTIGRELVPLLLAAGEKLRLLTRDPAKVKPGPGVDAIAGDLEKPETFAGALVGVDRIFSLSTGPRLAAQESNLAKAARQAGVRHVVKISVLGAGGQARSGVAAWHEAGEKAFQESGIAWTFVRPGNFMSNALQWARTVKEQGKVFSNYGDGKLPPIHPRDIAAVAAVALTKPGHEGKAYPLTGPEALSMAEQVRILSEAIGKPITYVPISDEAARDGMKRAGMPDALIDVLLPFGDYVRSGKAAAVLPTVEQVTGRKGLTFSQWARENAAAFA